MGLRGMRGAALTTAAALAVALGACGGDDGDGAAATTAAGDERVRVGLVGPLANEPVVRMLEGARRWAGANDAEVTGIDVGFDPQRQLRAVQDAVTSRRYDALIVTPFDQTGGNLKAAAEAGLPIVTAITTVGPDLDAAEPQFDWVTAQVFDPWTPGGTAYGEAIVDACEGVDPCKVALMSGQGLGAETKLIDAIEAVLDEQPNIETIVTRPGGYDPAVAKSIVADTLQANDDLSVVATVGDQMALGAIPAVAAAGRSDRVRIFGLAASARGIAAIEDGRMYGTLLQNSTPVTNGELAAAAAVGAVRGERPGERGIVPDYGDLPRMLTRDNAAAWRDFEPQFEG